MSRKFGQEQALTVLFIGVIAFLFVFQARVALQPNHRLSFIVEKMNIAFGAGSSSSASSSSSVITSETGLCTNSLDDDTDGQVDCADSDCAADIACMGSSSSSSSSLACGGDSGANQAVLYQGHCYLLYTSTDKTWANAKTACSTYNSAYLASLTTSLENSAMSGLTFAGGTWIGLNDQSVEGTYVWDHGNPFSYSNWTGGQPDNSGNQDCATIQTSRTWNDDVCGNTTDYLCEYAITATCGDAQKELSEGCDDGNTTDGDGCSASCTTESGWNCSGSLPTSCAQVCGNGIKTSGEGCDDGNTTDGDGCSASCTTESGWNCSGSAPSSCSEVCGNGVVTIGEECDDGNTSNGDGCSSSCTEQSGWNCTGSPSTCSTDCGDGIVTGSETCDDGNDIDTDACSNSCISASCGDGIVQPNGLDGIADNADDETCDDSGESATCNANCRAAVCGDQSVNATAGETCDDGNTSNTDGCLNSCINASCGDGYQRSGVEECEPPGVGTCGDSCQEVRGIGNVTHIETSSAASFARPPAHCGNGVIEPLLNETCDEGRFNGLSPRCDLWCNATFCGDGIVQRGAEECEPLRQQDGTFAAETCGGRECTIPVCSDAGTCVGGCNWAFLPACKNESISPSDFFEKEFSGQPSLSPAGSSSSFMNFELAIPPSSSSSSSSIPSVVAPVMSLPVFSIGIPASSSVSSDVIEAAPMCGNGIREAVEQCDDGSRNSDTLPDSCHTDCTLPSCGDKIVDFGEECDDGNDILGDGCTPQCTRSSCGNNTLEPGEECDDGPRNSDTLPDSCSTRCLLPTCGDGILDAGFGEQCDQGQNNSNTVADRCRLNCIRPHCGDSIKDSEEQCDDGNTSNIDSCSNTCKLIGCGNGVKDWNEQCDDGNKVNGDGCTAKCVIEKKSFFQWLNQAIRLPFQK